MFECEARPTRTGGGHGRDPAGTSSEKTGENPVRRKSKVSWARSIHPGLVGPKARPKGVADGKRVNIPVLPTDDKDRWGDAEG